LIVLYMQCTREKGVLIKMMVDKYLVIAYDIEKDSCDNIEKKG